MPILEIAESIAISRSVRAAKQLPLPDSYADVAQASAGWG